MKDSVIPFRENEGELEIDATKLGALWAQSADALHTVGEGFETVVTAINAFIEDNEQTRQESLRLTCDNRRTRLATILGTCGMLLICGVTLLIMRQVSSDISREMRENLKNQIAVLSDIQTEARQLRKETRMISRMQTATMDSQVAAHAADIAGPNQDVVKKLAERKVIKAELEIARGRLQLATTPEQKSDANENARHVVRKAKAQESLLGPMKLDGESDPLAKF